MNNKNPQNTQNAQNTQQKQDQVAVLRVKSRVRAGGKLDCAV